MSVITLQFGQCGNQIGQTLFSELYADIKGENRTVGDIQNSDYVSESAKRWFDVDSSGKWETRSILIDTEDKVVADAATGAPYTFKNVVAKAHGGAANNWACGYNDKSALVLAGVGEALRKETEKCDFVTTILNILSTGGGTGAGVGSRVAEVLREEYPSKLMMNSIVLPYKKGEVVTQNYNTLLSLSKLYELGDITFVYENDAIHRVCSKTLALTDFTFKEINLIIAQQMASILQPVDNLSVFQIAESLVTHPHYKLAHLDSAPFIPKEHVKYESAPTWTSLVNKVRTMAKSNTAPQDYRAKDADRTMKCVANLLVSRGNTVPTKKEVEPLCDVILYAPWSPLEARLMHHHEYRNFKDFNKFVTLATNSNVLSPTISAVLEDAALLFTNGAYMHHYKKYNIGEEYFKDAFETVEDIVGAYNAL